MGTGAGNNVLGDFKLPSRLRLTVLKERYFLSLGKKNIIISWEKRTSNQTIIIQCEKPLINMSVGAVVFLLIYR